MNESPFTSREVRWFFEGPLSDYAPLTEWFFHSGQPGHARSPSTPEWQPRRNDEPDVYLLLPGHEDMGIKWREGQLQVKGLLDDLGPRRFASHHAGIVQRWVKWSYGDLPDRYAKLLSTAGVDTVAVHKTRALRMLDLAPEEPAEVGPETVLERGMAVELTRIVVGGKEYCSVGFEAFPDDGLSDRRFDAAAGRFLEHLSGVRLDAGRSLSYAAWLNRVCPGGVKSNTPRENLPS